jgi:hypothetical protein
MQIVNPRIRGENMGMELTIKFPSTTPLWEAVRSNLKRAGVPVTIRMIDGLPAFPDEEPTSEWNEVRVSTPAGMLTLRRERNVLWLIVWGNADANLVHHWQILTWACAAAGDGLIDAPGGPQTADQYMQSARLFEV